MIESVNILVAANGNIIQSEVIGMVLLKTQLSGMPELRLGLNDKILLQNSGSTRKKAAFVQCENMCLFF